MATARITNFLIKQVLLTAIGMLQGRLYKFSNLVTTCDLVNFRPNFFRPKIFSAKRYFLDKNDFFGQRFIRTILCKKTIFWPKKSLAEEIWLKKKSFLR